MEVTVSIVCLVCYHVAELFLDDTCVQTGYWPAIADFVASLGTAVAPEKANSDSVK